MSQCTPHVPSQQEHSQLYCTPVKIMRSGPMPVRNFNIHLNAGKEKIPSCEHQ